LALATVDPAPQPVAVSAAAPVTSTEIVSEYRDVATAIEAEIPGACAHVDAHYALAHVEPPLLGHSTDREHCGREGSDAAAR
jgi:hypothetical protein